MTRAYVCMKISEYPPPPLGLWVGWVGVGLGRVARTRVGILDIIPVVAHAVLLNRLLIRIISLFQCGLPKETPILKNVLFCVVLVPETRDTPFSPPQTGPKHSLVYSYTYTFEYHGTYPVHSPSGLLFASKHLLRFPYIHTKTGDKILVLINHK